MTTTITEPMNTNSDKIQFSLPTTLAGWFALILITGTLVSGVSLVVVQADKVLSVADLDILPEANRRLLIVEANAARQQGIIDALPSTVTRISMLEDIIAHQQKHLANGDIHQTSDQEELSTIKNLQPIRNDIQALKMQISGIRKAVDTLVETR